jgi:hypothetical protein
MIGAPKFSILKMPRTGKPDTKARNGSAPIVISEWQTQKEIAQLAFNFWRARRFRNGWPEEDSIRALRDMGKRTERQKTKVGGLFLVRKPGF